jgi:hypothetical protein
MSTINRQEKPFIFIIGNAHNATTNITNLYHNTTAIVASIKIQKKTEI